MTHKWIKIECVQLKWEWGYAPFCGQRKENFLNYNNTNLKKFKTWKYKHEKQTFLLSLQFIAVESVEWRLESLGEVAISWRYFDLYVMEVVNLRAPFFSLNNSFLNEPSINQIDHSSDLFAQVTAQSRYFLFFYHEVALACQFRICVTGVACYPIHVQQVLLQSQNHYQRWGRGPLSRSRFQTICKRSITTDPTMWQKHK